MYIYRLCLRKHNTQLVSLKHIHLLFFFLHFRSSLGEMASLKAEKPVGTQLFGQVKKEPAAKASEGSSKTAASKPITNKKSAQKPQEPKKKGKGGKSSAAKH